jgi:hypothetical protein
VLQSAAPGRRRAVRRKHVVARFSLSWQCWRGRMGGGGGGGGSRKPAPPSRRVVFAIMLASTRQLAPRSRGNAMALVGVDALRRRRRLASRRADRRKEAATQRRRHRLWGGFLSFFGQPQRRRGGCLQIFGQRRRRRGRLLLLFRRMVLSKRFKRGAAQSRGKPAHLWLARRRGRVLQISHRRGCNGPGGGLSLAEKKGRREG